jgi:hypothetical protein
MRSRGSIYYGFHVRNLPTDKYGMLFCLYDVLQSFSNSARHADQFCTEKLKDLGSLVSRFTQLDRSVGIMENFIACTVMTLNCIEALFASALAWLLRYGQRGTTRIYPSRLPETWFFVVLPRILLPYFQTDSRVFAPTVHHG